jgi:DNA invertase Pin-like site-specific DNA recombinase
MQCVIYARVSTGAQAERQLSIPAQLAAMRQHAQQEGWTVLEEFLEAGVSGRTSERPELKRLLARCRQSDDQIDVVLVHKLDRLARNLADHVAIRSYLTKAKVRLVSVTENLDDSTSGQLVEHIMASLAEFYSANLADEVRKGLAERVKQGGWPHLQPLGYRRGAPDDKGRRRVELDPQKAIPLRWAFETMATGHHRASSVLVWLRQQGLRISQSHLHRLLRNPFYLRSAVMERPGLPRAAPLVSEELFDRVQIVLKDGGRSWNRRLGWSALLHGIARCHVCGSVVSTDRHGRHLYYRCRASSRVRNRCHARVVNVRQVHERLEQIYQDLVLTPAIRLVLQQAQEQRHEVENREGRRRQDMLAAHRAERQVRETRLAEALAEGFLDPDLYRLTITKLRQDAVDAEARHAPHPSRESTPEGEEAKTVLELHAGLSTEGQRALVTLVFEDLRIDPTGIVRYVLRPSVFNEMRTAA